MKGPTPWHSDESSDQYNSLFPLLPDYAAHFTIGGEYFPRIGLLTKESLYLKKEILTVLIADRLGVTYATAKKNYPPEINESRWLGLTDRIDAIFDYGQPRFDAYFSFAKDQPETAGSSKELSTQFYYRSLATFDASKRLAELGYLCEVAAILRMALEQFAFSAALWDFPSSEDLQKLRPVHCLNGFKKTVPASGKLYGLLSKYTHFEYDHHTHFFEHSDEAILTLQRAPILRGYATHVLFLTMVCISKYVLHAASRQFKQVPKAVSELSNFADLVSEYSDDVCKILPLDSVLARMNILLQELTTGIASSSS